MRARLSALVSAVVACAALAAAAAGCGGCDGGDTQPADAEPDGGPADEDGGADGSEDRDAAVDGGAADAAGDATRDGGGDGGRDGGPAGWTRLPGLPEDCRIERAEHPEALFAAEWVPCSGGRDGCQQLATAEGYSRAISRDAGFHDGERGYFAVVRSADDRRTVVLARTVGSPLGAWRDPLTSAGTCIVGMASFGPSAASFLVSYTSADGSVRENRVYQADYEEIGAVTEPHAVLTLDDLGGSHLQNVRPWGTWAAAEVQPAAYVALMESGRVHRLDPIAGVPQHVHLVERHAIWEEWGTSVRLVHGAADQATAPYYEVPDGDVKGFATNGEDMAWTQGYDRQPDGYYARAELWYSSYARTPGGLTARKVRDLDRVVREARVGAGYYAFRTGGEWHGLAVVRLSDGRIGRWTFPPDDSPRGTPLWVTPDEVAVAIGGGNLMRVQLSAFDWSE